MALTDAGLTRITGTVTHIGLLISGTEVTTVGTGYVRKAISFNAVSSNQITNNGAITFANPELAWGTIDAIGFFTAVSGGDMLFSGAPPAPITVNQDSQIAFANLALVVSG